MLFKNRREAGKKLASLLINQTFKDPIILGLPRGGIIVAKEVADALNAPLSLIITQKIGHPYNPEYAIGAVSDDESIIINENEIRDVAKEWLEKTKNEKIKEAIRRKKKYLRGKNLPSLKDRTVIIVDDGLATGFSMKLAVEIANKQRPKEIIVAVPICSKGSSANLKNSINEFISIVYDDNLSSIGEYYEDFTQVGDEEVIACLEKSKGK